MSAPARVTARSVWVCEANVLTCQHEHALVTHKSKFGLDQRRVDGHLFGYCQHCQPTTFFFGIVTSRPSPMVTCYAIDKAQYDRWQMDTDDPRSSPEMLYLLRGPDGRSYNPSWRPTRNV